ncbi:crotonase/enoyl-CoA hydratase family protein [Rhodococcus olei]|uniref:Crotonase/enoyl-CoA hydratase family protein n=1 Tax=Rhodococcus olei TaxID=2161675 RepID=A0ABP8NYC5_9NOCA
MSDELIVTYVENICVMTINRPQARNAVNGATARAIAEAVDALDERDDLSVGVITGAGGTFCAGMDLRGFLDGDRPSIEGRGFAGLVEQPPRKPLIAAVEGYALAGGCEIAIASDLVVAAETAKFGLPEVKRGLVPTGGGALKLHRQLPYHVAMELLFTGDWLTADRALQYGFVNRVVPEGAALDAALELARTIAGNGPLALEAIKRIVRESQDWSAAEGVRTQREIADPVFRSADAREGAKAFTERRAPVWTRR